MIELRTHQASDIDAIREHFRRWIHAVLWYLPTGAGKSLASAFMLLTASQGGKICWFIVHRRELIRQMEVIFKQLGIDYGIVAAGRPMQSWKKVQLCSINSLARRMSKLTKPQLVVLDEVHHLPSESWSNVLKEIGECYMVGLSASPCRLDGRGLGKYFGAMVKGLSIRELIAQGYLSKFRTFVPATVDTSGLHLRAGDYITAEAESLMDTPVITGSAVAEYRKLCDGKRAIVFCTSIQHSKHVAAQFRDAGYAAIHIDGKTDDRVRDMAIDDFERGKIQVLCNVDIAGEGLSINAIECVILLRPTQSLGLYIQQVGRGLRTWPGKECLTILDHVGSTLRFGFIDEPREWTLTMDTERQKKKPPPGIRVCPKCFAASAARALVCCDCGHVFEVQPRQEVKEKDGELVELTAEEIARKRERQEQGRAMTRAQLLEIARIKGRNPGWVDHVLAGREAKRRKQA
jgi:DNA repair protein RadD